MVKMVLWLPSWIKLLNVILFGKKLEFRAENYDVFMLKIDFSRLL